MKKQSFITILLFILLPLTSCNKLNNSISNIEYDTNISIKHIQERYNSIITTDNTTKSSNNAFLFFLEGNIPTWETPSYRNNDQKSIDIIAFSNKASTAYITITDNGQMVFINSELLYIRNRDNQADDFVLEYHIPEQNSDANSSTYSSYSGIILYTTLSGVPIRINKYNSGKISTGLYIPGLTDEEISEEGCNILIDMLCGVTFQRLNTKLNTKATSVYGGTLEASFCIAYRNDNESFADEILYEWRDLFRNEQHLDFSDIHITSNVGGAGGGVGKNSGIYHNPEDQDNVRLKKLKSIKISSSFPSRIDSYYKGAFKSISETSNPIVQNLIDALKTESISINLDSPNNNTSAEGSLSNLNIKINLACDQGNNILATLEEFFHAYQLQEGCIQQKWTKGDREFEAKIFDAILAYKNIFPQGQFELYILEYYYEYYCNPNNETYHHALTEYLRDFGELYPISEFPISDSMDPKNRIINIINLGTL